MILINAVDLNYISNKKFRQIKFRWINFVEKKLRTIFQNFVVTKFRRGFSTHKKDKNLLQLV